MDGNFVLVVLDNCNRQIPRVIEDYVLSLGCFTDVIGLSELGERYQRCPQQLFVLAQMIFSKEFLTQPFLQQPAIRRRLIFLNVEMLRKNYE